MGRKEGGEGERDEERGMGREGGRKGERERRKGEEREREGERRGRERVVIWSISQYHPK